jgi:hypothetical protein
MAPGVNSPVRTTGSAALSHHAGVRMVLIWALSLVSSRLGGVRRVEWAANPNQVKLEGAGVWVEMWADAQNVHAPGDILILGELLGGPWPWGLKQIVQQAFQKKLR